MKDFVNKSKTKRSKQNSFYLSIQIQQLLAGSYIFFYTFMLHVVSALWYLQFKSLPASYSDLTKIYLDNLLPSLLSSLLFSKTSTKA